MSFFLRENVEFIVGDGGPNGGKSSGLSRIAEFISANGYPVVTTPEAATEIMMRGITPKSFSDPLDFQRMVIKRMLDNEEIFGFGAQRLMQSSSRKRAFVLCDRGLMSAKAYMRDPSRLQKLFMEFGLDEERVRNERYAQVIHLCSTACGLPQLYEQTRACNPVRTETVEQARKLDKKLVDAWSGHHDLTIVRNDTSSFEEKLHVAVGAIARRIGLPTPLNIERKFLVDGCEHVVLPKKIVQAHIRQFYIKDDLYAREMRFSGGTTLYFKTEKTCTASAARFKSEKIITHAQFAELLAVHASRAVPFVEKDRYFFSYHDQYYRLDRFHSTEQPLMILEVQPTSIGSAIEIPSFISVNKEVTDDPMYYNYFIAQRSLRR